MEGRLPSIQVDGCKVSRFYDENPLSHKTQKVRPSGIRSLKAFLA